MYIWGRRLKIYIRACDGELGGGGGVWERELNMGKCLLAKSVVGVVDTGSRIYRPLHAASELSSRFNHVSKSYPRGLVSRTAQFVFNTHYIILVRARWPYICRLLLTLERDNNFQSKAGYSCRRNICLHTMPGVLIISLVDDPVEPRKVTHCG